jgi:hypothetical protein
VEPLDIQHLVGVMVSATRACTDLSNSDRFFCFLARWILLVGSSISGIYETQLTYHQGALTGSIALMSVLSAVSFWFGRMYWMDGHLHRLFRHVHWMRLLHEDTKEELQLDPFFVKAEKTALTSLVAFAVGLYALPTAMLVYWGYPEQGLSWYGGWLTFTVAVQLGGRQALWQHICFVHLEQARLLCELSRTGTHASISSEFHTARILVQETTEKFVDRSLTVAVIINLGVVAGCISGYAINAGLNVGMQGLFAG